MRDVKERGGRRFAITDAGRTGLGHLLHYEKRSFSLLSRDHCRPRAHTLTGPLCTEADVLEPRTTLPELRRGDLLLVHGTGADFTATETSFAFARPAIVMRDGGTGRVVRRRDTTDDFLARDLASK